MLFNYDRLVQAIDKSLSVPYENCTINGGTLDDIEKSSEEMYNLERENGRLEIYSDNVFAVLEEDKDLEEYEVTGSLRKSLRSLWKEELTYRDRNLMDLEMRF